MKDETLQTIIPVKDIQDQLFVVADILHAWPKSLKPHEYETIALLFEPEAFWKWSKPWDLTICVHTETHRCEFLLPEHQLLLLKQHIIDTYDIKLPPLPASFNSELWNGAWEISVKQVNSEAEMQVYINLAKTAAKTLRTAQKLQKTANSRVKQLQMAREKYQLHRKLWKQAGEAVFVAVDIECFELDHNCTTEVGVAILSIPGNTIETRHFLVKEYAHLRNGRFVPEMSGNFDFGTSEWVSLKECGHILYDILHPSDGVQMYFIGHDPMADMRYLEKNLRCPMPKDVCVFDTRLMFSAFSGDSVLRKLAVCLDDLDIEYWNLHNAGNDAYYTLAAFREMCLRDCLDDKVTINEEKPKLTVKDLEPQDLRQAKEELQKASEEKHNSVPKRGLQKAVELGDFCVSLTSGHSQKRYNGKNKKNKVNKENGQKDTQPTKEKDLISFHEFRCGGLQLVESSDAAVLSKQRDTKGASSNKHRQRKSTRHGWTQTDDMNLLKEKSIIDDLDAAFNCQAI